MINELFDPDPEKSPRWTPTTKLVVVLTLTAVIFALFISFRWFLGPILGSLIISYLIYPWARRISRLIHFPWRMTVTLLYLLILFGLMGVIAWGGITLVEQIQNLIKFLQTTVNDLPDMIARLTAKPQEIGPFIFEWQRLDVAALVNQLLGIVQPLLSQAGTLVGTIASSAVNIIGWSLFSIVLSYFIVSESQSSANRLMNVQIPGYRDDFKRIGSELSIVWNAFLRGQLILFTITAMIYMVTMSILGVHYNFGLALLAGLARFLPYIGPLISWSTDSIVAYSQGYTFFGLSTEYYMLTVLVTAWFTDAIIDNFISPRIFSNALKIHPAAVMVCALLAFNLMGILGIVLAAPALATLKLLFDYTVHKLLDMDPWANFERTTPPVPLRQVIRKYSLQGLDIARAVYLRVRAWIAQWRKPTGDHDISPSRHKN